MDKKNKKDNAKAMTGTILIHLALILGFMFFSLSKPSPLPEDEGVIVDLGYYDEGSGRVQPMSAAPPSSSVEPSQTETAEEEVVTQTIEETISMPDTDDPFTPEDDQVAEHKEEQTIDYDEPAEQEEPEPTPDPDAMFPGSDERETTAESKGETGETGYQGKPEGEIGGEGEAGQGDGVEFSLTGRKATYLPMPEYTSPETGRVVVSITVNRQGEIIRANAGARGTTTSNQTLWRLAKEAALKAEFDIKKDAPDQQRGTITYNFIRQN